MDNMGIFTVQKVTFVVNGGEDMYGKIKAILLIIALVILATGCGADARISYEKATAEEAMDLMADSADYIILDVRTREDYEQQRIPEAINIHLDDITEDKISEYASKDQPIFVYCNTGNSSGQAAEQLAKMGYSCVVDFGGIAEWEGDTEESIMTAQMRRTMEADEEIVYVCSKEEGCVPYKASEVIINKE